MALWREACFPTSVFGPVLFSAFRRLASICLYEVIGSHVPNWVRFVILTPADRLCSATDGSSATARVRQRSDRYQSSSTMPLHHHNDGLRDDVLDRVGQ